MLNRKGEWSSLNISSPEARRAMSAELVDSGYEVRKTRRTVGNKKVFVLEYREPGNGWADEASAAGKPEEAKPLEVAICLNGGHLPVKYGDWIDLFTAEETRLEAGEYRAISLGVSMILPAGYYALLAARSSTFESWGVLPANGISVIDNEYRGEGDIWHFPAVALRKTVIPKGTRICQFCLVRQPPKVEFSDANTLLGAGRGGLGSTGM